MTDDGFCTALRLSPSTAANCAMGDPLVSGQEPSRRYSR
jgi:hypothetical protein